MAKPNRRRGRSSGFGSVRIRNTAMTSAMIGTSATPDPTTTRKALSIQPPTGLAAWNHELAPTTNATPSNARAMPSRR
ncbi:Uncharacterised protein [Mycobacteroides abscessus subsp. abscessus]|nr:Uncharacterised protein [Mycobacteroides abscessus subsp. abscessus]SKT41646.1 Uncharacterised protein [Mycobacteroides abscessus subsp. abscessus]SKW61529.1 Uncharacterised protein [Mycobacteroides abscessus subsp. abscessus]